MNAADSDLMADYLLNRGFSLTDDSEKADIIIVNTCSVRYNAEHKALSYLGRIVPLKKKNPKLNIIFVGCMAQRVGEQIKKRFPIIDLVIGAKDIEQFPLFFERLATGNQLPDTRHGGQTSKKKGMGSLAVTGTRLPVAGGQSKVSACVTIMRGCENFCSYCIVPYVRGKEISRPPKEIITEIKKLVLSGTREVMLLGQNVNSYRDGNTDFPRLLALVNEIGGIERIRFMTSHPKDLSDKLIDAIAELDKVCEHLHLPIQSGSDKILKIMNRKYTSSDYFKIIEKLKNKIPELSFTTDILVGFPGETEKDFKLTIDAIKKVSFDALFAFKYSPRPGTSASKLEDNIAREIKEKRLKEVLDTANSVSDKKNAKLLNKTFDVLVEKKPDIFLEGRSRANKKVFFKGKKDFIGKTVPVRITEVKINTLIGEIAF